MTTVRASTRDVVRDLVADRVRDNDAATERAMAALSAIVEASKAITDQSQRSCFVCRRLTEEKLGHTNG